MRTGAVTVASSADRLDHDCAVALDNVVTVPKGLVGRTIGYLTAAQEARLTRAVVLAYDLEVPLLE